MSLIHSLSFNIVNHCAVSTRLNGEQWQAWAQGEVIAADLPVVTPKLEFMPAMQRRRLSLSARLLFQAVSSVLPKEKNCPTVFMSHDGEMPRSFELWLSLLRNNDVSPTSFGLSVHNALLGQLSMWRKDRSEYTALSALYDGVEIAVTEGCLLLAEGAPRVLVICVDEPLPEAFNVSPIQRPPFAYALALLLEVGKTWTLNLHGHDHPAENQSEYSPLSWLRHFYRDEKRWSRVGNHKVWEWQRK